VSTILDKEFCDNILRAASANLARDGELVPVLFLNLEGVGTTIVQLVDFPGRGDEKRAYLRALASIVRAQEGEILEALMIFEAWVVGREPSQAEKLLGVAVRDMPDRAEAVAIFGRSADGSRVTNLLVKIERDREGEPSMGVAEYPLYNASVTEEIGSESLLDAMFEEVEP